MAKSKIQEAAYDKIGDLVEHFASQIEALKKKQKEAETRIMYINPLFDALGWDIDNTKLRLPVSYKDVIHEDELKIGGKTKAPDYCFTNYGKRTFFLEAKKPSVLIKTDTDPSYQLRRYGWSAKLPISILTDFEEFAMYDCTKQPKENDATTVGRLKYITYDQYLKEFDWIWDLFSKEQVVKGSLEQFAKADKKGTQSVDYAFLQSLDEWRNLLATNIAIRNKQLDEDEINYIVQMNINRIVFLRNCEDRGAEAYGKLKDCLVNAKDEGAYFSNMYRLFGEADRKYNSGLFDFSKDTLSKSVVIDNKVISTIVSELYYPKSPYEFSVIGAEILGTAYERFLGKVIRLTAGHQAKVEEKPEVRKAGGVFYTPQYIVEYIVKNTVGKLVEGKTPEEIEKIKICDPACGSGSFLLGAYQFLLNYHTDWYTKNYKKSRNVKDSPLTPEGNLSTQIKKEILLNNIFGVDIDTQAVEVTKLSLLMKCMEGETAASMQTTLTFERVLPTLDTNIKSGNSLIDFDFYEGQLDFGEDKKIKPFNWKQAFPQVFKQGGFDVVIGNPPYVEFKQLDIQIKKALEPKYKTAKGKYDLFIPFIEKGLQLLNQNGVISYIVPSMFIKRDYGKEIRKYIAENAQIQKLIYFGDFQVFDQVTVFPFIFILSKNKTYQTSEIVLFPTQKGLNHFAVNKSLNNPLNDISLKYTISTNHFDSNPWSLQDDAIKSLKDKIEGTPNSVRLQDISKYIFVGIQSGKDEVFFLNEETINNQQLEREIVIPIFKGRDIMKYKSSWGGTYIIFPYDKESNKVIDENRLKNTYPNVYRYLKERRDLLKGRDYFEKSNKLWYELWCERNFQKFNQLKIVNAEISDNNRFYLDSSSFLGNTKTFNTVLIDDWKNQYLYVLGILNSSVLEFFHKQISVPKAGGFFEYKTQFLNHYPIRKINFNDKVEKIAHDEIVKNVELLLKINADLQDESDAKKKEQTQGRIAYAEQRINEIVYELYGLTKEEIQIIESQ
jgi:type I restriction-modification system DNA methylase subunit